MAIVVETKYTVERVKRFYNIRLKKSRIIFTVAAPIASFLFGYSLSMRDFSSSLDPDVLERTLLFHLVILPAIICTFMLVFLMPRRKKEFDNRTVKLMFFDREVYAEFDAVTKATFYYSGFFKVVCEGDIVYFVGTEQPVIADLSALSGEERQAILRIAQNCKGYV